MGESDLSHRVLAVSEEEGAERASYGLKLLQSDGELSIASSPRPTLVVRAMPRYMISSSAPAAGVSPRPFSQSSNIGLSLGGGGFTATLQRNPNIDAESVLLRLLELPTALFDRDGTPSLVAFDEIQDVLAVTGADGKIRSVIQHQADAVTYAFAGSAPGVMQQLFADPKRPLLDQAVPRNLAPLPLDAVGEYVSSRFQQSGRDVGFALTPFLEFTRGHPQRSMMLAHYLWERTRRGQAAEEGAWVSALDQAALDAAPLMRAIWRALTANERRVARALAVVSTPLHSTETAAAVSVL